MACHIRQKLLLLLFAVTTALCSFQLNGDVERNDHVMRIPLQFSENSNLAVTVEFDEPVEGDNHGKIRLIDEDNEIRYSSDIYFNLYFPYRCILVHAST